MSLLELAFENNEDSLSVRHFAVREPISGLFDVAILARSRMVGLDIESFVGRPAAFMMMGGALGGPRAWSGIATHFQLIQAEPTGLSSYYVRIAPQMYLLRLRKRNRIFQHLTIPQIIQKILQEYSIEHKMLTVDVHQEHEYRVQFEESDFDFVNRLCEEEGISYYFKQIAQGSQYSTEMILTDKPESRDDRPPLPFVYTPNQDARKEFVRHVKVAHRIRPGAAEFRDYDYVRPDFQLLGDAEKAKKPEDFYELYKYDPAALVKDRRGKPRVPVDFEGELVASIDLAAARRGKRLLTFDSNAYDLGPGALFTIKNHPRADISGDGVRFLCQEVNIEGTHDGEWNLQGTAAFVEEKSKIRFRPVKTTPKPVIEGVESAIVVGPKGEEIHTDEHGRVRVQFHWDRDGQFDEKSSCWIRVSQGWAGGAFGMIVLPRV
ncbi:MAG TPA: type VI secretion system tip protein TssI/VgrG, partial [Polyangium sp.]|nr:type VI secretion system tip protein TssI/VgrG [Polyangium sp.]